jgi:hypothetical protein
MVEGRVRKNDVVVDYAFFVADAKENDPSCDVLMNGAKGRVIRQLSKRTRKKHV